MKQFLFRSKGILLSIFVLTVMSLTFTEVVRAQNNQICPQDRQYPMIPKLSLTGGDGGYNKDLYPDGRIWITPSSAQKEREVLIPVFIDNGFYTQWDRIGGPQFIVPPIYSFQFSIMYDERALEAVSIETKVPEWHEEVADFEECLADGWHIKHDDISDTLYWRQVDMQKWQQTDDNLRGRKITVVGSSQMPLQITNRDFVDFKVLVYVRFKVKASYGEGIPDIFNFATPIYINNNDIRYNEWNPKQTPAWEIMQDYGSNTVATYGSSGYADECILAGFKNTPPYSQLEPVILGGAILRVFNGVPSFRISYGDVDLVPQPGEEGLYHLPNPITVDSNSVTPVTTGYDLIQLRNGVSDTRLSEITVETDEPWLKVKTVRIGNSQHPIKTATRSGFIPYIDEGILGDELDPRGTETIDDGEVYLQLIADPSAIKKDGDDDKTGKYVGYVTFKSPNADVEPVRLRVEFIYMRNPYEPTFDKQSGQVGGIFLTMKNNKNESLNLVFGTGIRATKGVDELYGETAFEVPLSQTQFDARFFLSPADAAKYNVPYGFGDMTPNRYNADKRAHSRDIRDYNSPYNSYRYWVRFNTAENQDYPIRVQWNVNDFPMGAQLYIRDTEDGNSFPAINMREATNLGNGMRQFLIAEPGVKEFFIEYTPARNTHLTDFDGNAIINPGWNLLSLPAKPLNSYYENVFPNAINIPLKWSTGPYQEEQYLKVGVGYFVKYSTTIDKTIIGTPIVGISIDNTPPNWEGPFEFTPVRVFKSSVADPDNPEAFGGWNLIGGLSFPASVYNISYDFYGDEIPNVDYTLKYGVWTYETQRGYHEVTTIEPGRGYWIKVDDNGYLEFLPEVPQSFLLGNKTNLDIRNNAKADLLANSTEITFSDAEFKTKSLYTTNYDEVTTFELPPLPAANIFDIRYADDKYVTNANEAYVRVQGVEYPLNVRFDNADADYVITDAYTNEVFGEVKKGETKFVTIESLPYGGLKLTKKSVVDAGGMTLQAYPNPASDMSKVSFTLPSESVVSLKLYDAIGNEVYSFADGTHEAGEYIETINVDGLANGTYILRLVSGNTSKSVKFNVVK